MKATRAQSTTAMAIFVLALITLSIGKPAAEAHAQQTQQYGPPIYPMEVIPGTAAFGDPTSYDYGGKHTGYDLEGHEGDAVFAVCNGTVVWWDDWPWQGLGSWVNTIWLDCGNGDYFGYSHLSDQKPHASVGQKVKQGEQLGALGHIDPNNPLISGYGDRDHLHFMKTHVDPRTINKGNLTWIWVNPLEGIDANLVPGSRSADINSSAPVEYPIGIKYQTTEYVYNMKLVLTRLGNGMNEWVIPADAVDVSYNTTAGDFIPETGYYTVYGTKGAGACDVATMLYHVANDSGILSARPNGTNDDHPQIPGVPLPAITIWNPGKDLLISNRTNQEVRIRWDLDSHPGYIKFWVESGAQSSVSQLPSTQKQDNPLIQAPMLGYEDQIKIYLEQTQRWLDSQQQVKVYVPQAPTNTAKLISGFNSTVTYWEPEIDKEATSTGVPPQMFATVMQIESCGYKDARGSSGEYGYMQVMPTHFAETELKSASEPTTNISVGGRVLSECWNAANGDVQKTVACYNAGPGRMFDSYANLPSVTQHYVDSAKKMMNPGMRDAEVKVYVTDHKSICDQASASEKSSPRENTVPQPAFSLASIGAIYYVLGFLGLIAVFAVLLWLKPETVATITNWVTEEAPLGWERIRFIFRLGFQWWYVDLALIIVLNPTIRALVAWGFLNWIKGSTTIFNAYILIFFVAVGINSWLRSTYYAKITRDRRGYVVVTQKQRGCLGSLWLIILQGLLIIALLASAAFAHAFSPLPAHLEGPGGTGTILPMEDLITALQNSALQQPNYDNVRAHYAEIVTRSNDVGYDPAFTMAIWLEESGGSNYQSYPTVADFGCISSEKANFDAQLSCFLSLWKTYQTSSSYQVCRGSDNELNLREFLLIFEGGYKSCRADQWTAESGFPERLRKYYAAITDGGTLNFGP